MKHRSALFAIAQNAKAKKIIATLLLTCIAGAASAADTQTTIVNKSQSQNAMKVTYRVFHQNNPRDERVLGETVTTTVTSSASVPLNLEGYKRVGIMVVEVDGHALPSYASYLCSAKASEKHHGFLGLELRSLEDQHGELTCSSGRGDTEE